MTLEINRILAQHSDAVLEADILAAGLVIAELKAMLAPFNFSRHDITIGEHALMISVKGLDDERYYWELVPRGTTALGMLVPRHTAALGMLYAAGGALSGLPDPVFKQLQGVTL